MFLIMRSFIAAVIRSAKVETLFLHTLYIFSCALKPCLMLICVIFMLFVAHHTRGARTSERVQAQRKEKKAYVFAVRRHSVQDPA